MTNITNPIAQKVRWYIYDHFVQQTRAPLVAETAQALALSIEETQLIYQSLHDNHALFLEPGGIEIRMANPFSAIETPFQVYHADGRIWWANCAWDVLAIPAMLHLDARLEMRCADCQEAVTLTVEDDQVMGQGQLVHFAIPFRHWYDDLINT